jgi:hypothetical protein
LSFTDGGVNSISAPQATVSLGSQVITGAVLSFTVMVCEQVAVLPQLSVAVQVLVITLLQSEPGFDSFSLKLTVTGPSQLSFAVTLAGAGTSS